MTAYRLDDRAASDVLRELVRSAAAASAVPHAQPDPSLGRPPMWSELLFAGDGVRDPTEPSQALLAGIATLYEGLAEHVSTLGDRALLAWLEGTLGIARREMEPDQVIASATAEARVIPVVLPSGTPLRGGKNAIGADRTYLTTDTLTVLGATLTGVSGYQAEATGDRATAWTDPAVPFEPFAPVPAVHRIDIVTDLLNVTGGSATVTLTFPSADPRHLTGVAWQQSTPDGLVSVASVVYSATAAVLQLAGDCGPMEIDGESLTFLRASFAGDAPPPSAFAFGSNGVRVQVARTSGVRPDGGFYNDGTVDITKEFQPFGPVPRRGDSFYLRSEEAFSKPLEWLGVTFNLLDDSTGLAYAVDYASPYQPWFGDFLNSHDVDLLAGFGYVSPEPSLVWQHHADGVWTTLISAGNELHGTASTEVSLGNVALTSPAEVAGVPGHFIRLFLSSGDFGWEAYLSRVANFAAEASGGSPDASDLIAPTAPVASTVTIGYRTRSMVVTDLRTRNGPMSGRPSGTGRVEPFRLPFDVTTGPVGVVSFGFALDSAHLGASLSFYGDIEQAPACGSAGRVHDVTWEYWSSTGNWRSLDLLDGSRGLRQSGLVRLVAPADWAAGCPDVSATTGRWVRLRTATPQFVGRLTAVHVDAVPARYLSELPDPSKDLGPLTPLATGALKGLRQPLSGLKVTNPVPGTPGRAAESDADYPARAVGVVRHRNRGIQAWDYEELLRSEFPEIAVVRTLPHTDADSCAQPGAVGLVVVPRTTERTPYPSVTLADRIATMLAPRIPMHASVTVLCPLYVTVRVRAEIVLLRGVAAAAARDRIGVALEAYLHPLGRTHVDFGRAIYASSLVALLEGMPDIDHVETFGLLDEHAGLAKVPVDACRGLIASAGDHELLLREQL